MDETSIQAILEQYNLLREQIKEYDDDTKEIQKQHRGLIKTRKVKVAPLVSEITKLEAQITEYLHDQNQTSIVYDGHEYNITEISRYRKPKTNELPEMLKKEMNMTEEQVSDILGVINCKIQKTTPLLNVLRKQN